MQLTLLHATWDCPIRVGGFPAGTKVVRLVGLRVIGPLEEVFVSRVAHKSKITIIFASVKIQI